MIFIRFPLSFLGVNPKFPCVLESVSRDATGIAKWMTVGKGCLVYVKEEAGLGNMSSLSSVEAERCALSVHLIRGTDLHLPFPRTFLSSTVYAWNIKNIRLLCCVSMLNLNTHRRHEITQGRPQTMGIGLGCLCGSILLFFRWCLQLWQIYYLL